MKSWTRTLNVEDAHDLLALAQPGRSLVEWSRTCRAGLGHLSAARSSELVRMVRDEFLEVDSDGRIQDGLFLRAYHGASALAQLDLVAVQWALSHPLTCVAAEQLVAPLLDAVPSGEDAELEVDAVEALVSAALSTTSAESRRKTRTVLLGALEGLGVVGDRGPGVQRAVRVSRGRPHAAAFGYMLLRELAERGLDAMLAVEAVESSLPLRLTCCGSAWARSCLVWNLERGVLVQRQDEIRAAVSLPGLRLRRQGA